MTFYVVRLFHVYKKFFLFILLIVCVTNDLFNNLIVFTL